MKKYLPVLLLPLATACFMERPLKKAASDNNKTYTVEYLFEHEGCKVYRFYDQGHYVYFTNCRGEIISNTDSTTVRNTIKRQ